MTANEYAERYKGYATFQKIAVDAFITGKACAQPKNVQKLEAELKDAKQELKELWDILHDPDKLTELISGL